MDIGHSIGYLELLVGGGVLSLLMYYRSGIRAGGQLLGVSSLILGIVGLVSSFLGIDGTAYSAIWLTFGLALLGVVFVEFKRPMLMLFLAIPFYVLALTFVISIPFMILFATLALEVGLLGAYGLSKQDVTASSAGRAREREGSPPVAPFDAILFLTRRLFPGALTQGLIFLSYSLLPIALTLFVSIFWLLVGTSYVAYGMVIIIGAYFAVVSGKLNTSAT